ncbi:hypothetical protein QQ73_08615, partial [Candidatus Endoriftia persephone str. Guaymas]|nr:hypothetical protein [Candidatus Endoriftia persephone str. Guaymas]
RNLATEVPIITLSAKSGSGLDEWLDWLHSEANKQLERVVLGETLTPKIQLEGRNWRGILGCRRFR